MAEHYVEIVQDKGNKVVKRMGPFPPRQAVKVRDGDGFNLDWDNYRIRVTPKLPASAEREDEDW